MKLTIFMFSCNLINLGLILIFEKPFLGWFLGTGFSIVFFYFLIKAKKDKKIITMQDGEVLFSQNPITFLITITIFIIGVIFGFLFPWLVVD